MDKISLEFTEEQLRILLSEDSGRQVKKDIVQTALEQTACSCKNCHAIKDKYFPDETVREKARHAFSSFDEFQRDLYKRMRILEEKQKDLFTITKCLSGSLGIIVEPLDKIKNILYSIVDRNKKWNLSTHLDILQDSLNSINGHIKFLTEKIILWEKWK